MAKDLFCYQAADYARYRPSYPETLILEVLQFVSGKDLAWDCATGNGQAAYLLAGHFNKVIATDISEKQIAFARQRENIEYVHSAAEQTPLFSNSVNLITVAQAYHWLDFNAFEAEARRVSKPGGVVAIWMYNLPVTHNSFINAIVNKFYKEITGPYWDAEREYLDENYQTVPFNFSLLHERELYMECEWSLNDMTGYLSSWSAVQHFIAANNFNPLTLILAELTKYWKKEEVIQISFPLFLKCGAI